MYTRNGQQISTWNYVDSQGTIYPGDGILSRPDVMASEGIVFVQDPPPAPPTPEQIAASLKAAAQSALAKSDITLIRCLENGVTVPAEWATYRKNLRAVIDGTQTTMPTQPAYPAGT